MAVRRARRAKPTPPVTRARKKKTPTREGAEVSILGRAQPSSGRSRRIPSHATPAGVMAESEAPGLKRALGLWDVTTITAGTILGSAIFVASAFVPREVSHPTLLAAAV